MYSFRHIAWTAFILAVILLLGIGLVAYRATDLLVASEKLVAHSHAVQTVLEDLRSDLLRANSSRRGYVITKSETLLRGYREGLDEIPRELGRLRSMTSDNPRQQASLAELQKVIENYLSLMTTSVNALQSGNPDPDLQVQITLQTADLGDTLRNRLKAMRDEEGMLLTERQRSSQRYYDTTQAILAIAFALALALLGAEFYLFNLEFTKRERSDENARQNRELVNAFFSSSTVGFAILDKDLRYRKVNDVLAGMSGFSAESLLDEKIQDVFGEGAPQVQAVLKRVLLTGEPVLDNEASGKLPGKPEETRHWLVNYFPIRDQFGQIVQIGIIALDVTARHNAETAVRKLSARLMTMQDQERRRIAREIHDSLGQYLAAVKINLQILVNGDQEKRYPMLPECLSMLDQCISETRTLSHLLHPPLLDEAGLASAARWFVTGFSQRSGLSVELDIPVDLVRLPNQVEIALFRILQEGLTNVHRHSGSLSADIRLRADAETVILEISDRGKGIPAPVLQKMRTEGTQFGVGLAGMRERMHELGGQLEIESEGLGTTIRAVIPVSTESEAQESMSRGAA